LAAFWAMVYKVHGIRLGDQCSHGWGTPCSSLHWISQWTKVPT
jgi:hypothetical protein